MRITTVVFSGNCRLPKLESELINFLRLPVILARLAEETTFVMRHYVSGHQSFPRICQKIGGATKNFRVDLHGSIFP